MSEGCPNCDDWEGNDELAVCTECWPKKIEQLRERVKELESCVNDMGHVIEGSGKATIFPVCQDHHITSKMIDEAVASADQDGLHLGDGWPALNKLGIFRCEGCGGSGKMAVAVPTQQYPDSEVEGLCPDCNGHGWVIGDRG